MQSGLDWNVSLRKLYVKRPAADGAQDFQLIHDHYSVCRDSDHRILGVVGKKFTPIQNRDAFKFLDELAGMLTYETAGSLLGGRVVFMLANLDNDIILGNSNEDTVKTYLLLANSHDGTKALTVRLTTVRVVCNNTLSLALGQEGKKFKIHHTSNSARNISTKVQDAAEFLGLVHNRVNSLGQYMHQLTQTSVTDEMLAGFVERMFPTPPDPEDDTRQRKNAREAMTSWYFDGPGQELSTARGTAWGLLNAATGYATHLKTVRVSGGVAIREEEGAEAYADAKRESRARSLLMGTGGSSAGFGMDALGAIQEMVPVEA